MALDPEPLDLQSLTKRTHPLQDVQHPPLLWRLTAGPDGLGEGCQGGMDGSTIGSLEGTATNDDHGVLGGLECLGEGV